ncbi:T-cell surface antigen CD2 [Neophocaena asiaeorientalis asiaeorientalis]|uniref:T-cell surface antigen CD2 n=1 Tax=Neophocaena asiaeorientalis asiaeorientalis TaxID=1706337 RepID=A0A341D0Z2_NEOAA|nr:T-cell surface antigen CD2 [Neophocaena asiaeorientalis asiaeorientalis]
MSLTCKILTSFLLIFAVSTKGEVSENTEVIWGCLDHDINLDIPGFQMNDRVADTRWDKNKIKIAQLKQDKPPYQITDTYVMLKNGTLKIKALKRNDSDVYTVSVYDLNGKNILEKAFDLKIQEMVSKPVISWSCTNRTLICEVAKGSDPKLKLFVNKTRVKESHQKAITHKWNGKWTSSFNCVASNNVSAQTSTVTISCSEKGLDIYLIIGICGGGTVFLVFLALLVFYISKRKKQRSRRNDEEMEIRGKRVTPEERGWKPHQIPGSTPQNPAMSQTPPIPGHRSQAPAHRPRPPGPRVQHQQKKRPPPTLGKQVHLQKGPPLPKPRVQTKPPCEVEENS